MAVAAVAVDIDHDIAAEFLAELESDPGHFDDCQGILAIHMENRGVDDLGDVGAIGRRAGIHRQGGEADLVVDDEVNGAAGFVAGQLGHIEGLGHDALADERGVAVNEEGEDFLPRGGVLENALTGAGLALNNRIDRLEVAGVCGHADFHRRSAGKLAGALVTEVVFHIAILAAAEFLGIEEVLELPENHARGFFDEIGKNIEAAAVGHAHDDFEHARGGAVLENRVEGDHERLAAFEGEAFLTDEFRVDERLESFGLVERLQHAAVEGGVVAVRSGAVFHAAHHPLADLAVMDVLELRAERGAVGFAERFDHLAEREGASVLEIAGGDHLIHLGLAEPEGRGFERGIQSRSGRDRVEMRAGVADRAVGAHEFVHLGLERRSGQAGAFFLFLDDASFEAEFEAFKKSGPIGGNRAPVLEPALVEFVDHRLVGTGGD